MLILTYPTNKRGREEASADGPTEEVRRKKTRSLCLRQSSQQGQPSTGTDIDPPLSYFSAEDEHNVHLHIPSSSHGRLPTDADADLDMADCGAFGYFTSGPNQCPHVEFPMSPTPVNSIASDTKGRIHTHSPPIYPVSTSNVNTDAALQANANFPPNCSPPSASEKDSHHNGEQRLQSSPQIIVHAQDSSLRGNDSSLPSYMYTDSGDSAVESPGELDRMRFSNSPSVVPNLQEYSDNLPPAVTSKKKVTLAMGFRADCDKCQRRVPGHYSHIVYA